MTKQVIKRNSSVEDFDIDKVIRSVKAAFSHYNSYSKDKIRFTREKEIELRTVLEQLDDNKHVEDIQDLIEEWLIKNGFFNIGKEYILYREEHKKARIIREKLDYIDKYIDTQDNASNLSNTDANANSSLKNITSLESEIYKDTNRLIQRQRMRELLAEINSPYKDNYIKDIDNHIIYQNDEASSPVQKPYCSAYSLYPLLLDGTNGLDGTKNTPPKHLSSFCGQFCNLVFLLSAQKKGAGAYAEFFNFFDYFAKKDFGDDYINHINDFYCVGGKLRKLLDKSNVWISTLDALKEHDFESDELNQMRDDIVDELVSKSNYEPYKEGKGVGSLTIGNMIDQYFQQITYYINQPAQNRGWQSPFTNFNVFDKFYWKAMFEHFYFPDGTQPEWKNIDFLQKRYMRWLNQERTHTILTFPVMTVCLLVDNEKCLDEDYESFVCEQWEKGDSFFVYTSDNPDSVASCCFEGKEIIKVMDETGKQIDISIEDFVNQFGDKVNQLGNSNLPKIYRICSTNEFNSNLIIDTRITGVLKRTYTGSMYKIFANNKSINVTADHIITVKKYLSKSKAEIMQITAEDLYQDDLSLYEIGTLDNYCSVAWRKINNIEKEDVENKIVFDIELYENHYFAANGIITHNCRLKNEITDNTFSSTTGLTGVQTGSCNVMTLNMSRIVQQFAKKKKYTEVGSWFTDEFYTDLGNWLRKILDRVYDYQKAYKTGLYKLDKNGMLPATKSGYISLTKLYCTIGVNGLNEAARFFGLKVTNNKKYLNFITFLLKTINEYNKEKSEPKFMFNLEIIPAESLGGKNYKWDKEDGYWVPEDKNLYNSYIYDAHDPNTTILDKIAMHGEGISANCSGGQAAHLNLSENLTKEQYFKLLRYAIKTKDRYITFNVPQSQCEDCRFISKHPIDVCPKCGSKKISYWTRIIGYLRPVESWGSDRQAEGMKRIYKDAEDNNKMCLNEKL